MHHPSDAPVKVNCNASKRYQVRLSIPGSRGTLVPPEAGEVTGIRLRLSTSEVGAAIDPTVNNLVATPTEDDPAVFYVEVSQALQQAHLLTLGVGAEYFAIWSKPGDLDMTSRRFLVSDRTVL